MYLFIDTYMWSSLIIVMTSCFTIAITMFIASGVSIVIITVNIVIVKNIIIVIV